jgi:hypothetical protein
MSTWDDWEDTPVICYACASSSCEHADDPDSAEQVWGIELEERFKSRLRVLAPSREDAEEAAIEALDPTGGLDSETEIVDSVRLKPPAEEP